MSEQKDDTIRTRIPLWVRILLVASLMVNVLIVGIVIGVVARGGPGGSGPLAQNYAMPYVIALPREDRRKLFRRLRSEGRSERLPQRSERRGLYREMLRTLEADTWDADRASDILKRQTSATIAVQSAAQAAWLEAVTGFSVDERRAYADRVREVLERGRRPK